MKTESRANLLFAGVKTAALWLALAAALAGTFGAAPQAQTANVGAKPQQFKLGVKQRGKKTDVKLAVERGALTDVTATDAGGTRSLKRIDKFAVPCADEEKECKTVELESGVLVGVCYCKDTQTALLLPAVQKIREARRRSQSSASGGHVKVFDGKSITDNKSDEQKPVCWTDEKLKLSICAQ